MSAVTDGVGPDHEEVQILDTPPAHPDQLRSYVASRSHDPLPDLPERAPADVVRWIAVPGQAELARLHALVHAAFAANRFVHYARNYEDLASSAHFRRQVPPGTHELRVRSTGSLTARLDGVAMAVTAGDQDRHLIRVNSRGGVLELAVTAPEGEPAMFAVEDPVPGMGRGWDASRDGTAWEEAAVHVRPAHRLPHHADEPVTTLAMTRDGGLFAIEAAVLGRPVLRCEDAPRIATGETPEEAVADAVGHETRHDLVQRPDGAWTTRHQLGFRYLRIDHPAEVDVSVEAAARPSPRRGAFACSDPRLTDIWVTSAYTLRQCMHGLMVDGIKRDRLPWAGDLALSTLSNAYAFADPAIVQDTLVALGQPRHGYVNGISDYSLWWLVSHGFYARYFDAGRHLAREAERIHRFVERLADDADTDGVFRPKEVEGAFMTVFLDWGADVDPTRDSTALQLLWAWALRVAGDALQAAGHPGAQRWQRLWPQVTAMLAARAWDEAAGTWRDYLDGPESATPYPSILAVLSGFHGPHVPSGVRQALLDAPRVGTPFMTAFALRALAAAGHREEAVSRVRDLWGGMLDAGARTFWEDFPEPGEDPHAMYGRPFGRSLCHAWGAGPAALLPETVLGLRPLADAWSRFEVAPALGRLGWAGALVPTPTGEIFVVADRDGTAVHVPAGSTLVAGPVEHVGPTEVRL